MANGLKLCNYWCEFVESTFVCVEREVDIGADDHCLPVVDRVCVLYFCVAIPA